MSELEAQFLLFKLNERKEEFEQIDLENNNFQDMLDSLSIYIIVDPIDKDIWIWNGNKAKVRLKFIASQKAPYIRDSYGIDFRIRSVDEGDEIQEFKNFLNLL
jgi:hypothetical protein